MLLHRCRRPLELEAHHARWRVLADQLLELLVVGPEGFQNSDSYPGMTRIPGETGVLKPLRLDAEVGAASGLTVRNELRHDPPWTI